MPFPLFHGFIFKKKSPKNVAYSMLPDFLGLVNASLWDKMHNRAKIQQFVDQNGTNEALDGILNHLDVDALMNYHIHTKRGLLSPVRESIAKELRESFNIGGKFLADMSEVIIEFSLDQILAEKYHFMNEFEQALKKLSPEETGEQLRKFLRKSKRKIKKYILELKTIQPSELLTLDGVIRIAKNRYGFNLSSILEVGRNVRSYSLRGVLRNVRVIRKLLHDPVYFSKVRDIQEKHKIMIEPRFKELLKAFEDEHPAKH